MNKYCYLLVLLAYNSGVFGQSHSVFHIGHSLVSPYMPAMVNTFADSTPSISHSYNYGIINGSPLFWAWANSGTAQGYQASTVDSRTELALGNYDVFVMTEGVPWDPIISDFHAFADSFHTAALNGNPSIQTYLYESWNCLNTGLPTGCMYNNGDTILWADRIRADLATWESVADSLNLKHPGAQPVRIVPVGQAFANLKDSIDAGRVPGISDVFTEFFLDDIHPNDTGFYFVALVHVATIYQIDPQGLPTQTFSEWGVPFSNVPADLAAKLQEIAWHTVCGYPRSGVNCNLTSIPPNELSESVSVYPNPSRGWLRLSGFEEGNFQLRNTSGQEIMRGQVIAWQLDLSYLPAGLYLLSLSNDFGQMSHHRVILRD